MLNKVKMIGIVGLVLGIVRAAVPGANVGEEGGDFQTAVEVLINSLYVIIPIAIGWFVKETKKTTDALTLKP